MNREETVTWQQDPDSYQKCVSGEQGNSSYSTAAHRTKHYQAEQLPVSYCPLLVLLSEAEST